jgi:hypothetical protein
MKTTEQKQHEAEMKQLREHFAKLWNEQLAWDSKELGVHPNPGVEHLAWKAFLAGKGKVI